MTDTIANKIVSVVTPIVTLYFEEAETQVYPYAFYTLDTEERRSKEGVYRIKADTSITIVAKDYDTAKALCGRVRTALEGMNDPKYIVAFKSVSRACVEGVWSININYSISQIS